MTQTKPGDGTQTKPNQQGDENADSSIPTGENKPGTSVDSQKPDSESGTQGDPDGNDDEASEGDAGDNSADDETSDLSDDDDNGMDIAKLPDEKPSGDDSIGTEAPPFGNGWKRITNFDSGCFWTSRALVLLPEKTEKPETRVFEEDLKKRDTSFALGSLGYMRRPRRTFGARRAVASW